MDTENRQDRKWTGPEQVAQLLGELVKVPSITGTDGEEEMARKLVTLLGELEYFRANPGALKLTPAGNGISILSALVRQPGRTGTVVLVSHYDVVGISDYGDWEPYAWSMEALTAMLYSNPARLPDTVRRDLENGEQSWLFGRGVMDMKCGIALHMSLLEKAACGEFDGNLLMLSVPDEEANSAGMRAAVPLLLELAQEWGLEYRLALNSEPIFPQHPGDEALYLYTGSIGKMLPGFLCCGQETHVGEPFAGFNANYMAAVLTAELEWNPGLCEFGQDQSTPPPTNLMHRDLSSGYSAQVPHRAAVLFNLLQMERPAAEALELLKQAALRAAARMEEDFASRAQAYAAMNPFPIPCRRVNVLTYEELLRAAVARRGEEAVSTALNLRLQAILTDLTPPGREPDGRETTIALADALASLCKELAPMIVLFVAPPFYPAAASGGNPFIRSLADELAGYAREQFGLELAEVAYFPGISDLSYMGNAQSAGMMDSLAPNMPLWGKGYDIPFEAMGQLQIPVLNLGPAGRDAHKRTERLEAEFAFRSLPDLLTAAIRTALK